MNIKKGTSLFVIVGCCFFSIVQNMYAEFRTPQDLISEALENNLELEISRLDYGIREDLVESEKGAFSPIFLVEVGTDRLYRRQNAEQLTNAGGIFGSPDPFYEQDNRYLRSGLSGRLPLGSTYQFVAESSRLDSTFTDRSASAFDPEYSARVNLNVVQPLLRNFGFEVNLAPLNVAKNDLEVAQLETVSAVETVIARVLLAVYEVYFSVRNIEVKEESIELAQALLDENRKRVELGNMSAISITLAESRVAEAEAELIQAKNFYQQRQNQLQQLTQHSYDLEAAFFELSDVESLLAEIPESLAQNELAVVMLTQNSDYLAEMKKVETEDIRVKYSQNQVYPEINLRTTIGSSGLENDVGQSFSDIENRKSPDWGVGLEFRMALDNRTAKSNYSAAKKRKFKALLGAKQVEIQLLNALDNAAGELEAGIKRLALIEESVRLAREALVMEERRLENGLTTNYAVLEQQRELSESQTDKLAAEVEVKKAWIQVLFLQGQLSKTLGFDVQFKDNKEQYNEQT